MPWFNFNLHDFSLSFLSILFEGIPFMFVGTLLSGIIDSFLPAKTLEKILPKNVSLAIFLAGLLGMVFPMCECGVIPVIRRMIRKGLPVAPAVTYLLAAPIINPIVVMSTLAAFRGQDAATVLAFRMTLAFGIACLVGFILLRLDLRKILVPDLLQAPSSSKRMRTHVPLFSSVPSEDLPLDRLASSLPTFASRVTRAIRTACFDFLDVAFYLVIGSMLTAVFNTAVNREMVIQPLAENVWLSTYSLSGLAFLLSLCSTSDAFIAANFVAFPLSAKLAFMVLGPMMDFKLIFLYGLIFRKSFMAILAVSLFVGIGLLCIHLVPFLQ